MSKVAIFGASGFVGATLAERMLAKNEHEIVPIIRSPGNAWRLSRHSNMDLCQVDLLSGQGMDKALKGVDYVINCTRGTNDDMLQGLNKLIKASKQHKVKRFVHLSSVMVFGDPPLAPTEDSPTVEQPVETYGGVKLKQDKMVITAAKEGLSASILVPPNISGPYSDYLLGLLGTINSGEFALMDNGVAPSNLVDVQNLCQAIELAMTEGRNDASRYFITDDETTTWSDMIGDLQDLQVTEAEMMSISRSELEQAVIEPPAPKGSIGLSMKHLVSSHIREALRKDPLWEKFDLTMRGLVASMGSKIEDTLRLSIEGEALVNKRKEGLKFNARICGQQLREGRHSIARARSELGYSPEVSYRQSMDNFKTWYRRLHVLDGKFADMLRQLYS